MVDIRENYNGDWEIKFEESDTYEEKELVRKNELRRMQQSTRNTKQERTRMNNEDDPYDCGRLPPEDDEYWFKKKN